MVLLITTTGNLPPLRPWRRIGAWILPGDQLNSTIHRAARLLRLRPRHARTGRPRCADLLNTVRSPRPHSSKPWHSCEEDGFPSPRDQNLVSTHYAPGRQKPGERGSPLKRCRACILERIADHSLNNMSTLVSGSGDECGLNVACYDCVELDNIMLAARREQARQQGFHRDFPGYCRYAPCVRQVYSKRILPSSTAAADIHDLGDFLGEWMWAIASWGVVSWYISATTRLCRRNHGGVRGLARDSCYTFYHV